jgi:hypothetical protein
MSLLEETFIPTPSLLGGPVKVEVFQPEHPFGGVIVEGVPDFPLQIELNTGSPVLSVFGRTGNITPQFSDYDEFYAPLGVAAPVSSVFGRIGAIVATQNDYVAFYALKAAGMPVGGTNGQILAKQSSTSLDAHWVDPPAASTVSSVFGRTGAIVAASSDYTFAQIGSKPTTLAGYGITDPILLATGSYSDPSWLTSLAWAKITGAPAFITGNQAITLTGDLTGSGTTSIAATIAAGTRANWDTAFSDRMKWDGGGAGLVAATGRSSLGLVIGTNVEAWLGNPGTSGFVLSSTSAGVRSWVAAGGTGTVTSFSAGDLAPIFTTTEANPTTTPALSFALSNAAAHTFLGNETGGTAAPHYVQPNFTDLAGIATTAQGGVPAGGTIGQVLMKNSNTNYDVKWADVVTPT